MTGRVDAHHHLWDLAVRDHAWIDPDRMSRIRRDFSTVDLAAAVAGTGVERTVVVQSVAVAAETAELLAVAAADDLVAGVVGWVDLTDPAVADRLAELVAGPGGDRLVGIRHLVQAEPDPRWLCRPDVRRGLAAVAAAGLAYDLLVFPHQLPAATEAARALSDLRLVLDHLGKPPIAAGALEPWAGLLRRLAAEPGVTVKLSGMVTEASSSGWTVEDLRPFADTALNAFGPDRTMFGSDWPVCLLAADGYADVLAAADALTAGLSAGERAAVFGGTADRVYGLDAGRDHHLGPTSRASATVAQCPAGSRLGGRRAGRFAVGLTEDVIERIKKMIIDGELVPGQRLPVEKDLAARLQVSRNSLREAVRALTMIRVLQTRQGDGTYVTSLSPELLLETVGFVADLHHDDTTLQFLEVRRLLEPEAAAMAATRIGTADLERLGDLLAEAERIAARTPVDHDRMVTNDQAFHGLINHASGNPVLATVAESMSGATTRARVWRGITQENATERTLAEHRSIMVALAQRDPARARLYAAVHIAGVEDWLRAAAG